MKLAYQPTPSEVTLGGWEIVFFFKKKRRKKKENKKRTFYLSSIEWVADNTENRIE